MSFKPIALLLATLAASSCVQPTAPPTPLPAPDPEPEVEPFPHRVAWTAEPETTLRAEGRRISLEHAFTRLEVLEPAEDGMLRVRCPGCPGSEEGLVAREDVVYEAGAPVLAAEGDLADFILAIREAAAERDVAALRPVLYSWFTHSVEAPHGAAEAIAQWRRESFRSLDRLPSTLDRGVSTDDGSLWVSPPEFLADRAYRGMRAGFERGEDGRWRWVFLVEGAG